MQTKLILIDGPDGVGKTTLIQNLADAAHGYSSVLCVREPGTTALGERTRARLKSGFYDAKPALAVFELAAQRNALQNELGKMLQANPQDTLIIQDRGIYSTIAYNLPDLPDTEFGHSVRDSNFWWGENPGIYKHNFILNATLDQCLARIKARGGEDRIDSNLAKLTRAHAVYQGFSSGIFDLLLPANLLKPVVILGLRPPEVLVAEIFAHINV